MCNVMHKNLSLLFKWLWRFFDDPTQLWCQVIKSKYKYPSTFTIANLAIPSNGGQWKHLCVAILKHALGHKIIGFKGG